MEEKEEYKLRFEKLFETFQDGILLLNYETGVIENVNPAVTKILGYKKEGLIGRKPWDVKFFGEKERCEKIFRELKAKKEVHYKSLSAKTKSGEKIEVELTGNVYSVDYKKLVQCRIRNITADREAEEKLRESEERFRKIFEHSVLGIAIVKMDGKFLQVNKALCRMMGYSEKELLKKTYNQLIFPEETEQTKKAILKILSGKEDYESFEEKFVSKDRRVIWVALNIAMIKDSNNKPKYFLFRIENINKRKETEDRLRESEERFRKIFEFSGIGTSLVALDGKWLQVNKALCRITGYSEEELLTKAYLQITYPEDVEKTKNLTMDLLSGKKDYGYLEKRYIHKNGEIIWVALSIAVVKDLNGKVAYFVVHTEDINRRKRAEDKLKESEEKYKTVSEKANDGIIIVQDTRIKYANHAIEKMSGLDLKKIIGKSFMQFVSPEKIPELILNYRKRLRGENVPSKYETILVGRGNKKIFAELNARKINYSGKYADLIIIHDITEKKMYQEQLEEKVKIRTEELMHNKSELEESVKKLKFSYKQLETLDKMKSDFINLTAHEIKTPITPILIQADSLQRGDLGKLNQRQVESLGIISRNIKRLNQLLEQILNLSRMKQNMALIKREEDINKIIRDSVEVMKPLAEGNKVDIKLNLRKVPKLKMDAEKINQVLINLIDNAIKFNNSNNPWVTVSTKAEGKNILVRVTDNGIGIKKKDMEKLFKPFSQIGEVETKKKGTGLGLNISKTIIEMHGGKIWAESKFKGNTTFYFTLPIQ